jgi:membrane-associated phospholipid phosphatase
MEKLSLILWVLLVIIGIMLTTKLVLLGWILCGIGGFMSGITLAKILKN